MDAHDELPLLDEEAELLEKEKTLLNLKLLEQNIEAREWKAKYEELVNKVVLENENNLTSYEIAANIEVSDLWKQNLDGILQHLSATKDNHLSISHIPLSNASLKQIIRALALSHVSILRMSHCDLSDEMDELTVLLSKHKFTAIDFSNNNLGGDFFAKLMLTFRVNLLYL